VAGQGANQTSGQVFNTINFRSDLTATNGQTLIVGGIIQKQQSNTLRKTPILGSIPGLKWVFNKENKTSQDTELMVFLRPRIIHSPNDAKAALAEADAQAPLIKKWQEDTAKQDKKSKGE
jgi:general secretion pathway protein D